MPASSPTLDAAQRAQLASGDLVFIAIRSPLYRKIAQTCRSWDSHVGLVFREPDGSLVVAESRVPRASYTTLDKFLARSEGAFAFRRLRGGLTSDAAERLRAACDRRLGRIYHLGFDFDANREFCSKFVYGAYLEALGVEVGRLETFRELLAGNPHAPLGFWRAWFLGFIPWRRRTVTPTSQLRSERLEEVALAGAARAT